MKSLGRFSTVAMIVTGMLNNGACESSSSVGIVQAEAEGRFEANVTGALETRFDGTGFFSSDPDYRLDLPAKFQFFSRGTGKSQGESINGVWFGGGKPDIGTYELTTPKWGASQGFWMFYGDTREQYAVSEGEIEIIHSSTERVRGRFEAEAWQYCSLPVTDSQGWCADLDGSLPNVAKIHLSGSFDLIPWDPSAVTPE